MEPKYVLQLPGLMNQGLMSMKGYFPYTSQSSITEATPADTA